MRSIGVLEAKTSFSSLLDEVQDTGEPVLITRHGRPVARLVAEPGRRRLSGAELAERTSVFRGKQTDDPDWAAMSWEQLKAIARDEDPGR
jgi:prevent-host-death family protein